MSDLIQRMRIHLADMSPHQRECEFGDLLVECLAELHASNQVATNNADWFDSLVNDLSDVLKCDKNAAAVVAAVKHLKYSRAELSDELMCNPKYLNSMRPQPVEMMDVNRHPTSSPLSVPLGLIVAIVLLLSGTRLEAQRGTMAFVTPVSAPAVTMFAPALSAVQPPTRATNLAYNVGLTWDSAPLSGVSYRIKYGTNIGSAFLTNTVTTTNTFCTISNLALRPAWYFQAFSMLGTNVSEGSNILPIQPPLEAAFVLSTVFPLYTSTNGINWITNKIVTLVQTNPPGMSFFRSHFRQLDYQWTNNQIALRPFSIP